MHRLTRIANAVAFSSVLLAGLTVARTGEGWTQYKYDARHSGNVPERNVTTPLGLIGAAPCTDAIFTAPVVAGGRVFVVDGSGMAHCLDAQTLEVVWRFASAGGNANCNNVSSPTIAGRYLHFGTMGGTYYVLDAATGKVVEQIDCSEPIFSSPVVANDRVYFATLGSRVHAIEMDGTVIWTWDFVKERLGFSGNRWSGKDWLAHKNGHPVTWEDCFCCTRNLAIHGKALVLPAGGQIVWLEDAGNQARYRTAYLRNTTAGSGAPATFGLSIAPDSTVYRTWHKRDNFGAIEWLRLGKNDQIEEGNVSGSAARFRPTAARLRDGHLLGFAAVSIRGDDLYRCRLEQGFGIYKHASGEQDAQPLGGYPSNASPILAGDSAVFGGMDGGLHVVSLSGSQENRSF